MSEREEATVEEMAHYLSEWLDDQAPFHERGIYRMVADDMVKKFAIIARHANHCPLRMIPSWPTEKCTCAAVSTSTESENTK